MLAERERASKEMRLEFARMQRAAFLVWLARRAPGIREELREASRQADNNEYLDWEDVRREMNARFDSAHEPDEDCATSPTVSRHGFARRGVSASRLHRRHPAGPVDRLRQDVPHPTLCRAASPSPACPPGHSPPRRHDRAASDAVDWI